MMIIAIRRFTCPVLLSLLLFIPGCSDKSLEIPAADEELLDAMAEVRRGEAGHGLLVSRSGLIAVLPVSDFATDPLPVPARGLFWKGYRILDGWSWQATETGQTDPGQLAAQRPDRIDRPVTGIGTERLLLDPQSASGVVFLADGPAKLVRFIPRFDLRPIEVPHATVQIEWDETAEALVASLPEEGLYCALVSNGGYADGPQEQRVEYVSGWGPLDAVASLREPGLFSFSRAKGAAIGFAVANGREEAIRLAHSALDKRGEIAKRARDRALGALDRTAFRSKDRLFAAAAAWDIWWVTEGLLVERGAQVHRLARAPLPYAGDPVADCNTVPALLAIRPSDIAPARELFRSLDETMAREDLEGYAYSLSHLASDRMLLSWLGSDSALIEHTHLLAKYSPNFRLRADSLTFNLVSRWDMDLQDAGLPHPDLSTHSGIGRMLLSAIDDISTPMRRANLNNPELEQLLDYLSVTVLRQTTFPKHILTHPPESWSAELVGEYKSASTDPRLSLAWFERRSLLKKHRGDEVTATLAMQIWTDEHGLHFHAANPYSRMAFQAPRWLAWHQLHQGNTPLSGLQVDAYLRPEYWTWVLNEPDAGYALRGGAIVDLEVAARRLNVLVRDLIGLEWKMNSARPAGDNYSTPVPMITGFSLRPTSPLEFWEERAVSFAIGDEQARLHVEMDPYDGLYRFSLQPGSRDMQIDLLDVPVEGTQLVGSFALQEGRMIEVKRLMTGPGVWTLTVNGIELQTMTRQDVR